MTRVYKLDIVYPEGSHEPGWRPACWSDPEYLRTMDRKLRRELERREFKWPRERLFLSSSGAYGRAGLLRWYGAEVEVFASEPVTWPNYDDVTAALGDDAWDDPRYSSAMHWTPGTELVADHRDRERTAEVAARLRWPREPQWPDLPPTPEELEQGTEPLDAVPVARKLEARNAEAAL